MSVEELERRLRGSIVERKERVGKRVDLPVYSVTNSGGIQTADKTFAKQVYSRELANYKVLRKGWYAYNPSRVDVGSLARNELGADGCISPFYTVFELTDPGIHSEFFRHFVFSKRFNERVNANLQGSVRDVLTFGALEAFPLYLPPFPEQSAIAEVLQSIEATMARKRELIGTLGETKKAVMRELLTKGTRRDNAALKPLPERWVLGRIAGGVDQILKDWKLVRLTSVAKLESGHTPNRDTPEYWGGTIPWLSLGDTDALDQLTIESTLEKVTEKGIKNSSARVLPVDTVIFSRTATVGKACRLGVEMATSQDFANWVCGSDLDPRYLVQVFRHMKREWDRLQAGSTHQTIYMPTFKRLQILLPPKEEQKKIADTGEAFDRLIEAEKQSLAELQNTHAALAQELLSGRLRLPASMVARFENSLPSGKTSEAVTA